MTAWREWYEWRGPESPDPAPEAQWKIICRGTYAESVTNVNLDDLDVRLYEDNGEKTAEFQTLAPKVHKKFLMGTVSMDRSGRVSLKPRWEETMSVDPQTRKVSLRCKCRTDIGVCKYQLAINLDRLIVILTQEIGNIPEPHLTFESRPERTGPPKSLILNFWPGEWFKSNLAADELITHRAEQNDAIAEYRKRRLPEIVTDTKGRAIVSLP